MTRPVTLSEPHFSQHTLNKYASLMAQGNGYLGLRASHEEDYTRQTRGMYLTGLYHRAGKGEINELVNLPDVVGMEIAINGEIISLSREAWQRELNFASGELRRNVVWSSASGARYAIASRRFVSAEQLPLMALEISITPLDADASVLISTGIDATQTNHGRQHLDETQVRVFGQHLMQGIYTTQDGRSDVAISCCCQVSGDVQQCYTAKERRLMTEKVLGTGEKPAWHFTPDVTAGFTPEPSPFEQMSQEELNAQAKTLLSAAGYGPQKPLKLTLLYNTSENHQKIAIAVASMWKKNLGVDVKLQNQEWKTYIDSRNTGNFDVIRASWVGDYNEPSTFLTLLTSTHSGNISRFNNPAYDKVLAQASTENTVKARNADYNAAEKILMEQAPIAPIYQYTNGRLIKPWLKGYPINNPEDVAYSRTMYIVKH
ncbi:hypothetical protein G7N21_07650 [Escherichia coli]|nr:hypothetical protein [Escherichia coli]